jgi:arylsulfatase A-like enzyme
MVKRIVLVFLGMSMALHGFAQDGDANSAQKDRKMNVVLFLVDDMGWSDLGCYGSPLYKTPHIDRLAKKGVRFTEAYAASHVCSPSRGAIISGQYPARTHLTDWLPGRKDFPFQKLLNARIVQHLPYGKPTLPRMLEENGYATAIFGKWHLGDDSASTERQGFQVHVPQWNEGWPNGTYFYPFKMKGLEGKKGDYLTDNLTTAALDWVQQHKDGPFFLFLSQFAVHDPIEGPPHLVEKYTHILQHQTPPETRPPFILEQNPDEEHPYSRRQLTAMLQDTLYQGYSILPDRIVKVKQYQDNPEYAAMVESVDRNMGRVLAKLKELGLADNTIVIFASDNGGMSAANFFKPDRNIPTGMLDRAYSTSNLPLRGGKGWLYEGGIRVPTIIYWPGKGLHGQVCGVPVMNTDFYPTILAMLGITPPAGYPLDGMSLVPLLRGDRKGTLAIEHRPLYWHFPQYSNHGAQSPGGAIRYGDYKLLEYFENYKVQLFDIRTDPGELQDLAGKEPGRVKQLTAMLHAWRKKIHANMPSPNPAYDASLGEQWQDWHPAPKPGKKKK